MSSIATGVESAIPSVARLARQNGSATNLNDTERMVSVATGSCMMLTGLSKGSLGGLCLAALGGSLVYRGASGWCRLYEMLGVNTSEHSGPASLQSGEGFRIEKTVKIRRSPEELFNFWRQLENLPQVFPHIKSVTQTDQKHSHWTARGPFNTDLEWDAEILEEKPGMYLSWKSLPGSQVATAGSVHFRAAEHSEDTEVNVLLRYSPPGGGVSRTIASLFDQAPDQQVEEDLQRFKQCMESAECESQSRTGTAAIHS